MEKPQNESLRVLTLVNSKKTKWEDWRRIGNEGDTISESLLGKNGRIWINKPKLKVGQIDRIGKKMKWSDEMCRLWSSPLDMTDFSILKIRLEYDHLAW
jgi:exosome complex RNA-binding protein Rrp4